MIPSVVCVIAGWNYTTGFIGVNSSSVVSGKEDIKVLSYNTHFFTGISTDDTSPSIFEVGDYLKNNGNPGIICLQELNFKFKDDLLQKFEGFKFVGAEGKRTAILTKYTIIDQGEIDFGTRTNSCMWVDLLISQDTVRVYSIHLQSSNITKVADKMLDNIDLQEKSTWRDARNILSRYRTTAVTRAQQAEMIRDHASRVNHRIIIAGDMNEPPSSYTYFKLSKDMQDSFREKGVGIESTFGGRIPFLRIDYILADKQFEVINYETHNVDYSDHYPITATLRIKN